MNMKTNKRMTRIVLLALVLLMTLSALVSCGGKPQKTLSVDETLIFTNKEKDKEAEEKDKHQLEGSELVDIAKAFASAYSADFNSQELLIAAYRGYDMQKENFEAPAYPAPIIGTEEERLTIVKKVLASVNGKASDKFALDDDDYKDISLRDVQTLIESFQISVSTKSDAGLWGGILSWIGSILRWMTNTLGFRNYLVGICLFALVIEVLMLPFAIKQQKNSIRQAKLRPKEMAIRNKYKGRNDQVTMQKMQQEIQEFYQRENFSPYSGCLPLLIQLPIIMALYSIVIDPLHYVMGQSAEVSSAISTYYSAATAAGGFGGELATSNGTIAILSDMGESALAGLKDFAYFSNSAEVFDSLNGIFKSMPNFNIGPINFGLAPNFARFDILLLVPVLTFVTYFFTSKINRKFMAQPTATGGPDERQVACSNNIMDITMPLMSTFFTFMVPALVGIYWIFRSLVGMLKQFILSKLMPLPQFTEEDYKRAAKEMAGKRVVKKSDRVGTVRSLHHIDDEDFEDTRERALARKSAIEERERLEQQEKAKKTPFGASALKEENKRPESKKEKKEQASVEKTEKEELLQSVQDANATVDQAPTTDQAANTAEQSGDEQN